MSRDRRRRTGRLPVLRVRDPGAQGRLVLLDLNDLQETFHWGGTISGTAAKGTLSFAFPAFTYDGGLQSCGSGDVSWTASELVPASRVRPAAAGSVTQIRVSRDAATGRITISTTK